MAGAHSIHEDARIIPFDAAGRRRFRWNSRNYATNLETPRAIGCAISFIDLAFEQGFRFDFDALAAAMTQNTRIVSVTCPHNLSGVMLSEDDWSRCAGV